jgi:hypothetical protein
VGGCGDTAEDPGYSRAWEQGVGLCQSIQQHAAGSVGPDGKLSQQQQQQQQHGSVKFTLEVCRWGVSVEALGM